MPEKTAPVTHKVSPDLARVTSSLGLRFIICKMRVRGQASKVFPNVMILSYMELVYYYQKTIF